MNVEVLLYAFLVIFVVLSVVVLGRFALGNYLRWSEANRRANELLHSVLTSEQYLQLARNGYLDIPSPRDPGCIYRVPQAQGLVWVIKQGRRNMSLCLQPLEWIPDADMVVMHKLMIEADEETYWQTANKIPRISTADADD